MRDASNDTDSLHQWQAERPRLLGLAYTVLGSWQDAEDVVSEAWLRMESASDTDGAPRDMPAWSTTVVSRLALDAATSAAKRRESYVGPWLPEVVLEDAGPADRVVLGEQVDLAFVRLLQTLSPLDRVIVVLADVAGMGHAQIAELVGTTPSATRQRLRRARASLSKTPEAASPVVADRDVLDALAEALNTGDLQALVEQLSEDCVLWTDSGGLTRAARNPIIGSAKVVRFLDGLIGKYGMPDLSVVEASSGPLLRADSSDLTRGITLEVTDGKVTGLQIQQNPGKIIRQG
ncbi:MAG TPA: sigma-70 family RNA polymerase sigma factor [Candidatus Corynebacterium avicola]|uniref:Sigma-70 family RNA polymerase sigma factor n=1 Tax=Candidatus Corynebacterium avicola TaxID=2838527 RepID=A0A9D1RNL1_9CORY|nr:sigma-70 family RNA polymerase sigma factor [Candidatus Corynebacterium avicola]